MSNKSGDVSTERVPEHGQAVYRAAFDAARAGGAAEADAHVAAWAAVRRKFKKRGEEWVSRDGDRVMRARDAWNKPVTEKVSKRVLLDNQRQCPDCEGDGVNDDGTDCETCEGAGYLDDDLQDGAVRLTDSFVMDGVRKTKDGYLVADARIARTGIQLYAGDEIGAPSMKVVRVYRAPEDVFDKAALRSLAHRPITLDHPPSMVDADNWKKYAVGHTGDEVAVDGDCVRVPMVIMDSKAIAAYEKHGVKELSVGYSTELKWGRGETPDGKIYDAKQTAIRGNHLAVVPAARGGSRLRIGDDSSNTTRDTKGVTMVKILVDGQSIEFADELAAKHVQTHLESLHKQLSDAKKKIDDGAVEKEQEEEKKTRAEKDAQTKGGEIVALKAQLADATAKISGKALDDIVKARADLLTKADAVMDGKVNFDGKEPAEIRRAVVVAKLGDETAKNLTDDEIAGAFKALTAGVKSRTGVDRLADSLSGLRDGGGANDKDPKAVKDAAYGDYVTRTRDAWRGPVAAAK